MGRTYIDASNYTPLFVDESVLNKIREDIDGFTRIDFSNVNVMDKYISNLANIMMEEEVEIVGLDSESFTLLESYMMKISEPDYSDMEEFKVMFSAKFPKGELCVWDKSLQDEIETGENLYSLVMVEFIENNRVYFRLYRSSLMEPKHIYKYGGINSKELYSIENIHISEFMKKNIMFRYPKDSREEEIFELFKSI